MKTKKLTPVLILLLGFFGSANAQDWQTDLNAAEKTAAQNNDPIILVFQGSDWCAPCIKLNREIWTSEKFKTYAKKHYVMLLADFPRKEKNALSPEQQEKNNQLAEKYNPNGYFPFVVLLNKNGKILGQTTYKNMTPGDYIKHLNSFLN